MLFPNFIEKQSFVPPAKTTIPVQVLHPLMPISTILVLLVLLGFLLLLRWGGHCQGTQPSELSTLLGAAPLGATLSTRAVLQHCRACHWVHNEAQELGLLFKSQSAKVKWHGLEFKKDKVVLQGCQKNNFPIGRSELMDFTANTRNFIGI